VEGGARSGDENARRRLITIFVQKMKEKGWVYKGERKQCGLRYMYIYIYIYISVNPEMEE
jgi:hypothetical protein